MSVPKVAATNKNHGSYGLLAGPRDFVTTYTWAQSATCTFDNTYKGDCP